MSKTIFITGTDTGVGKTHVSCALIRALQNAGRSVLAVKPVASGAEPIDGELKNEDALALQQALQSSVPYPLLNPFVFAPAIAPHIAARQAGVELSVARIAESLSWLRESDAEVVIIEGAGGWLVPLNERETFADLAASVGDGVVLVVGMRLGCINHALLSVSAIAQSGLPLLGWVANNPQPRMPMYDENLAYLREHIQAPMLAELAYNETALSLDSGTLAHLLG
ncbi:dethiobiotin synthase [Permianibacter aggregans]|uniref:ATP-dependent dethiobiotin synthetase BioD n=1 Tax=Permianibacter aggregans TaxID=1510150 RepID=A0A4R6UQ34_9GAMM|nr:dethiobiotin synthase [Permianibacter aggregans]QGX40505.1 dethiobiotin synthase [Permianibacter aggregans]TDQ49350.1 dethiobiotin synthetase [Permianibacter aggregans]